MGQRNSWWQKISTEICATEWFQVSIIFLFVFLSPLERHFLMHVGMWVVSQRFWIKKARTVINLGFFQSNRLSTTVNLFSFTSFNNLLTNGFQLFFLILAACWQVCQTQIWPFVSPAKFHGTIDQPNSRTSFGFQPNCGTRVIVELNWRKVVLIPLKFGNITQSPDKIFSQQKSIGTIFSSLISFKNGLLRSWGFLLGI